MTVFTFETQPCIVCGKRSKFTLTQAEAERLCATDDNGRPWFLIQDALPERDADFRELVKTGIHPDCWETMKPDDEED